MQKPYPQTAPAHQRVRAPRGADLSCKGWQQEAALRMLMNSLDSDVAEKPEELIVSGCSGKVAADWESFHAIAESLKTLEDSETLLVRSGKPAGISRTDVSAPRVLIAGSAVIDYSNNSQNSEELARKGLMMSGAVAATSWTYVGTQTALPAACETFAAVSEKHFGGTLAGKLVVCGGMGGLGGAQPVAASLSGAAFLGIDADPERVKRRVKTGYCDVMVNDLDEALRILKNAVRKREAHSVGLVGNCAEIIPALARRGVVPDVLTNYTSADDSVGGYIPQGLTVAQAVELRDADPEQYRNRSLRSMEAHAEAIIALQKLGSIVLGRGNNILAAAHEETNKPAHETTRSASTYVRPLALDERGILRWVALSGQPSDIHRIDQLALENFPHDESLARWMAVARKRVRFQGLPARVCWISYRGQARFGLAVNDLVARGELKGPVVIARDSFEFAAAESARVPVEQIPDATAPVAIAFFLDRMLDSANGASWMCIDRVLAGGVHWRITRTLVADGSKEMTERMSRVLSSHGGAASLP